MTATPERALIRRIADSRRDVSELVGELIKLPHASDEVLDALDQRILDSGVLAPFLVVVPYLQKYPRHKLLAALCESRSFQNGDLAQLFKAGYGDISIERTLCKWLYEIYEQEGNPWRVAVVEALRERGGLESLRLLEDLRFELDPKLKTDIVVARSIAQLDEVDLGQHLAVISAGALKAFLALLDSAVATLRNRVGSDDAIEPAPVERSTPERDLMPLLPKASARAAIRHARSEKVGQHKSKAEKLLNEHPDASLTYMRKAAEAICKDLLEETASRAKGNGGRQPVTLEDMRSELRQRKVAIPADADKYLAAIQSFGNLGSHDQEIDPSRIDSRMAGSTLALLKGLIEWYEFFEPGPPD